MKRAATLVYTNFKHTAKGFRFYYLIDGEEYSFWISTDHKKISIDKQSKKLVLFHIGLSFLIDIAVICCPKKIIIKPSKLSGDQLRLWKWIYEQSSLESAYDGKKDLHFLDTQWVVNKNAEKYVMFSKNKKEENVTIAMSGGKESLTALKIYKNCPNLSLFFFDYNDKNSFHMRKAAKYLKKKYNYYQISTNISHVNTLSKKYGCKTYSLFVIGQLIFNSLLYSDTIDYLVIGNEYSSNFGNATYKGKTVNHQFDKTIFFAEKINAYIKKYFNNVITYTSPFFGLYEYKIAELFFADNDYLHIWTSCNESNTKHNFCCACAKCAFIYMISLPFTERKTLDTYFYKNPLENLKLCKTLIDTRSEKPTDCVGEKKECWVALYKILQQKKADETRVIQYFKKALLPKIEKDLKKMEVEIISEHTEWKYLPKKLLQYFINNDLIPIRHCTK